MVNKKRLVAITLAILMLVIECVSLFSCGTKIENFELSFNVDGENYATITTTGTETIQIPENPSKDGYTFDGWYWDKDVWSKPFTANSLLDAPISSDMSVYAKFTPIAYSISYEMDGGTHNNPATYTIESNFEFADAQKAGYTFLGWYTDATYTTQIKSISAGTTGDMTLYAKFELATYSIAYENTKGAENTNPSTYTINSETITFAPLSKDGYTFGGWYVGDTKVMEISKGSTGDITLTAKWDVNSYGITYNNVTGATNNNPTEYDVEDQPLTLTDASKVGYKFLGWYSDENFTNKVTEIAVGTTGPVELWAKWEAIEYTATFMDGNTVVAEIPFTVETESITAPDVPTHAGYTGVWEDYTLGTEDITINAVYTLIPYGITYHNVSGATNSNPATYDVEDEPLVLADAQKNYYNFLGWYSDETFTNKVTEIAVGTTGPVELWAKWEAIEYTATFMDGNTVVAEIPFTVETESITAPDVPTHAGYTGVWESYTLGHEDITINAIYTPITYTITYNNTKGVAHSNPTRYNIESATIILTNISAKGYEFDGWFDANGNQVTEIPNGSIGDIVLYARWTAIKYNITYMYDADIGDYADENKNPAYYTIEDDFDFIALVNKTQGYTFNGWFTEKNNGTGEQVLGIELGSTGDITVYAQWGLKDYTVTYHNVNGVTNTNPESYNVETETFTIEDVSKIGYSFDGWFSDEALTIPADTTIEKGSYGDLNFYAKWTLVGYSITYVLYGETTDDTTNPDGYTIEDAFTLKAPSRDGYIFVGWYTLAENGTRVTEIKANTTGNQTLYARWIKFESNGGSAVSYTPVHSGNTISAPDAPTRAHYEFNGWYTNEELTQKYNFKPTKSITLYAKWIPVEYEIEYILNGGTNSKDNPDTYTVEDKFELCAPNKVGYTFVGWFTDPEFTSTVVTEIKAGTSGKITLYAHYLINQYTISFESNGGTTVSAITQNYATDVTAPESPAKNGYEFAGWYSDAALKKAYIFTTMPAEDIMLYAKWNIVTYDITYNLDGGTNHRNNPSTYKITSADITLGTPTKTGYTFDGWYTDSACTQPITKIANGSFGDIELFAKWTATVYTVTYNMPSGAAQSNAATYTIETDLLTLTNATLKGHTFNGWYSDESYTTPVTTIAGGTIGDVVLYAKFTANTYNVWLEGDEEAKHTVSFDLNGAEGTVASQTVTPTATLKYPTTPTRNEYIFAGWYDNAACTGAPYDFTAVVTKDTTLYAKWVKIENASLITINGNANVTLNGKTEQMLMFVPLVSGNITITSSGEYDTFGTLYNAEMVALVQNDDGAADGINFHIVYNVTAGETYYIGARAFSSTTIGGSATVNISGDTTVLDGGYAITTSQTPITYGTSFTLTLPDARDGYKFLGYADANGVMYTDASGNSIKNWDKDEDTILYSVWERTVYTVTFVTSGGTPIDSIKLAYGDRFDISKYVTTRDGYTFNGWYLDGAEYNATTMPDHNITLTAYWKTFALGTIKYDTDKKAISVNDTITPELFDALCLDTNGNLATFTVSMSGTQAAGETITVRLTATSGGKTKVVTITDIKVYGAPTLTFDNTVDYVNVNGGMTASHFGASGTDTFGAATEIKVYIDGEYEVGTLVKIVIESIDPAGNIIYGYIESVKAYGLPEITYNENKTAISVNDTFNAELFGATAKDSFGEDLDVFVNISGFANGDIYSYNTSTNKDYKYFTALNSETYTLHYKNDASGDRTYIMVYCVTTGTTVKSASYYTNYSSYNTMTFSVTAGYEYYICTYAYSSSYNTNFSMYLTKTGYALEEGGIVIVRISATDSKGNVTNIDAQCNLYGMPTISNATMTDVRANDAVTPELLGITAADAYGEDLIVSLTTKDGSQTAGTIWTVTATVIDQAGNVLSKDFEFKVYGAPTISYDKFAINITEDMTANSAVALNAIATDNFGNPLIVTATVKTGSLTAGTYIVYTLTATDHLGNTNNIDTAPIGVYDVNDIKLTYSAGMSDLIKFSSKGEEFDAKATDSFGNLCDIAIEAAEGYTLEGGKIITLYIVATDKAGNVVKSEAISDIKVYDVSEIIFNQENYLITEDTDINFLFTIVDSFGEELYADIAVEGEQIAGNTIVITVTATDDADDTVTKQYIFGVLPFEKPFVELYVDGKLWNAFFVDDANNYVLPKPELQEGFESLWLDKEGKAYSQTDGVGLIELTENIQLYYVTYKTDYTPIYTVEQFKAIALNNADAKYYLVRDLDLNGSNWTPIGTKDTSFQGEFDGNGHIISNFKITRSIAYSGLFGYNKGTIKNLGIKDFSINVTSNEYYSYAGGLIGYNDNGKIMNCYAVGSVISKVNGNAIWDSINGGYDSYCYSYAGGLVGYNNYGEMTGCYTTGDISSSSSSSNPSDSSYYSSDSTNYSYAGGIVGSNNYGVIINCHATSKVTSSSSSDADGELCKDTNRSYAGGLVGCNTGGEITKCYALGSVSSKSSTTNSDRYADFSYTSSTSYTGGLVGYNSEGIMTNCYAMGDVNSNAIADGAVYGITEYAYSHTGGLVGNNKRGTIINSFATGDVYSSCTATDSGNSCAGGLVGNNENGTIANSYATGIVTSNAQYASTVGYAGGLAGYSKDATITNCYTTGSVTNKIYYNGSGYTGGLVGYNNGCAITNCYRCSEQTISGPNSNTLGDKKDICELQSITFQSRSLGLFANYWNFVEGEHPTLKNVGTSN